MAANAQQQQTSPPPIDAGAEFTDEYDLRLFESHRHGDIDLGGRLIRAKRNDPGVVSITIAEPVELGETASGRLGSIIGQSNYVKFFTIFLFGGVDVEAMCAGLRHNRSIQQLWLTDIDLGDADKMASLAPFLRHNPSLKKIRLQNCCIGPAGFDILSRALSDRTGNTLVKLDLSNNPIGDDGLEGLIRALDGGINLRTLDLSGCKIGRRTCISLATLLGNQGSKLKRLDLSDNNIGDVGLVGIFQALGLGGGASLRRLRLSDCEIGRRTCISLATLLGNQGSKIEELDLSCNDIGDAGLGAIFRALGLGGGASLRTLSLSSCEIGRRTYNLLAQLLRNQESELTHLDIDRNPINNESAIILAGSLVKNKKLKRLNLEDSDNIADVCSPFLTIVCDTSSIDAVMRSNHVLHSLHGWMNVKKDIIQALVKKDIIQALGEDDGSLLHASLELNGKCRFESENILIARQKIIWGHVRGDLDLAKADGIPAGAMPRILAWVGEDSDASNAGLAPVGIGKARLDAFHRILRSRPDLWSYGGAVPDEGEGRREEEAVTRTIREVDKPVEETGSKRRRV